MRLLAKENLKSDYMTRDEILKLKAATLYIIKKEAAIDYFHLFKILYFADRDHYAKYGRRIIKDTFIAMNNGPVPSGLYDAIKELQKGNHLPKRSSLKDISNVIYLIGDDAPCYISSKENPDMDELSRSDIGFLDKSHEENVNLKFGELSEKSHDSAWKETAVNSAINDILIAKAGGASDDTIEYIKERNLVDGLIR